MQNVMYQLLLYQQKTIRNYQNYQVKDLKDQFIGKVIDNAVVEIAANNAEKHIRELLDQLCIDSFNKYFLPTFKIENYNIEID